MIRQGILFSEAKLNAALPKQNKYNKYERYNSDHKEKNF